MFNELVCNVGSQNYIAVIMVIYSLGEIDINNCRIKLILCVLFISWVINIY